MSGRIITCLVVIVSLFISVSMAAQTSDIRQYRQAHEYQILKDFRELLKLPNGSSNLDNMMINARWITDYIGKRGFSSEIVTAGNAPYIIANKQVPGASKTLLIYAHFDGQPVAAENWASPPFEPTLRDGMVESGSSVIPWPAEGSVHDPKWRIFARSAGDDKGPVIGLMTALDALEAAGQTPSVNIKLILDGEEEAGSPTLDKILAEHGDKLAADLMLFCDAPMHQSRQRQLVFGARGTYSVHLTTYGPARPLHSGHYGGWAPSPTDRMMRLLTAMKDDQGNIIIPGYKDQLREITEAEKAALDALPEIGNSLAFDLALGEVEGGGKRLEELIMQPAIIVKGFQAGGVGKKSRNIIMSEAKASLNLRLVPNQTPEETRKTMTAFFEQQGFYLVDEEPSADILRAHKKVLKVNWGTGYRAFRTALDSEPAIKLVSILKDLDNKETLLTPTMGGSLPIYLFEDALKGMPIILLPIANHDNNQHGRNENIRLQNLWDAIEIYAAVLAQYGEN